MFDDLFVYPGIKGRYHAAPLFGDGIKPSRFHPGETVPKGLIRDEVLRLLATTETGRPVDLRDRAILMLLIIARRSG